MIVHLNGWPGVGKKTIGDILAKMLGARFIHNHVLHDVAIACSGLHGEDRWELYESVRLAAYAALARRPASEIFVMTNALCDGSVREQAAWRHVVDLAITRKAALIPVVLETSLEENCRRIQYPDRSGRKMTDVRMLQEFRTTDVIQKPDVPELLVLDVSSQSPEHAATSIRCHINSLSSGLQPATLGHLRFPRS
jgi:gluconate kinase